jgi:DNA polymerase III sliding clamp (beta) subunit (PCNA family)
MNGVLPLNQAVTLRINSNLTIHTQSPERGAYKWQIPCRFEGKDKTVTIAFNARYLIEAIKSYYSQEVLLEFKEPSGDTYTPAVINGKAVVMPVRV